MTREEALEIAKKCTQQENGKGYWGRCWDAIADALIAAHSEGWDEGWKDAKDDSH